MELNGIKWVKFLAVTILLLVFTQIFSAPNWFSKIVRERRGRTATSNEFIESLWNDISTLSNQYSLDPVFITAVVAAESNFINTKGPGGVIGYMQILPSTARGIAKLLGFETPKEGFENMLWDQKKNIQYGTAYLSYLYKKSGTLKGALMAYNNGPKKEQYAESILKLYSRYSELAKAEETKNTVSTASNTVEQVNTETVNSEITQSATDITITVESTNTEHKQMQND